MLILVAVTISMAINGGLFDYAGKATSETENAIEKEQELANGKVQIDGTWYNSIDDYLNNEPMFDAEAWDEDAAPEDVFIWQSDDPNDEGYGVVVAYTANAQNYTTLKYPSRCTKITLTDSYITDSQMRSYTGNIKEIELPNTVIEIGENAFHGDAYTYLDFNSLKKVVISDSVVSIGESAFYGCKSLTSITIGNGVTSIGESAFWGCNNLTSIIIGNSVVSIGDFAFVHCSSLKNIFIPDSVTSIGDWVFDNCSSLTNINVNEKNTTYIDIDGVLYSKDRTELIRYPEGKNETDYIILSGVTSIGRYAFGRCSSLTSVTIPDSVTSIQNGAFHYCTGLASVTIPDSVTSIGSNAFQNVQHIYYTGSATGSPWGASAIN